MMRRYVLLALVGMLVVASVWASGRLPVAVLAQGGEDSGGAEAVAAPQGAIIDDPALNPCTDCVRLDPAFTYQGYLQRSGAGYNGQCAFRFDLFDAAVDGLEIGVPYTADGVNVTQGYFTVDVRLPEPDPWIGEGRWLQIEVKCAGETEFTLLGPRQRISPTPFALSLPGFWTQPNEYTPNIIGGFSRNYIGPGVIAGTISGGGTQGSPNLVTGSYGTVGGGRSNEAANKHATVSGGVRNIAGGEGSFVGSGSRNEANGEGTAIAGGARNTAEGLAAMIPGGHLNRADGDYSFAGGRRAKVAAHHDGSFVWADGQNFDFNSQTTNEFAVRATGGTRFISRIHSGNGTPLNGVQLWPGAGTWAGLSDRHAKVNVATVDAREVLERLAQVPVSTWNYVAQEESIRHMGPMAQDFYRAFGLGEDERYISSGDADGVALAAIQGLYAMATEREAETQRLAAENARLRADVNELQARLERLERQAGEQPGAGGGVGNWTLVVMLAAMVGLVARGTRR